MVKAARCWRGANTRGAAKPTKPLALLTTLHNLQEHTEGPTNQAWMEVYAKLEGEVNEAMAAFEKDLAESMKPFER